MPWIPRFSLKDEFVVDEMPEAVYEAAFDQRDHADLVQDLAEMLRDQERLREINESLRASQGTEDSRELDFLIRRFIARLDGFDRILDAFRSMPPTEEVNNYLRSLEGLYYKIQEDLKNVGLTPIETLGKDIDLNCMEVADYRQTREHPHNTVINELKRGYRYKGKVIRDAQVVVAHNEGR